MAARADDWRREPGRGRYARPERERRFLVVRLPDVLGEPRHIEDRYVDGTMLRLRRLTVGDEHVFKLTQKVRLTSDPAEASTTNAYLSAEEFDRLSVLPAASLTKTRCVCPWQGWAFAVDEFHGRLDGLRLAEVEVPSLDAPLPLAEWLGREVTGDDRFSGAALARADDAQVAALLAATR